MITKENTENIAPRQHFSSWVVRLTGARGSGKSLLLAMLGIGELIHGRKVWSNMPLIITPEAIEWGMRYCSAQTRQLYCKELVGTKSLPLDWDAFYSLSEDLNIGTVLIDEAQYFCDSRAALSLKNRLLNAIVAQVRKRNLNLYYTVKQSDWIDRRLSYETDIEIECQGMHHTDWGREIEIPQGEMVITRWYDLSGAATGNPIDPKNKWHSSYKGLIYKNLHMLWGCYDTAAVVDLEEAFTNVKLDLKQRVISNKQTEADYSTAIYEVASHIARAGNDEIGTAKFWEIAKQAGIEGSAQHLGKYLTNMGITRKQKYGGSYSYDLRNLEQGA